MRLTCPTCGARYDIDDDLIPSGGRDVQCSNCNATWFQLGTPRRPATVEPLRVDRKGDGAASDQPVLPSDAEDEAGGEATADADAREGADEPAPEGRAESVRDVLAEERAFEVRAREAEKAAAEGEGEDRGPAVDPALGRMLAGTGKGQQARGEPEAASEGARERARIAAAAALARSRDRGANAGATEDGGSRAVAMASAAPDPVAPSPPSPPRPRRDRLPDIATVEEPVARRNRRDPGDDAWADEGPRGGFATGFLGVIAIVAILLAAYVFAADIAAAAPDVARPLDAYVAFVDAQRATLARGVEALTIRLSGLAD